MGDFRTRVKRWSKLNLISGSSQEIDDNVVERVRISFLILSFLRNTVSFIKAVKEKCAHAVDSVGAPFHESGVYEGCEYSNIEMFVGLLSY